MNVKFPRVQGKPIAVLNFDDPDEKKNIRQINTEIEGILDSFEGTLYRVFDFTGAKLAFSDMVMGMALDRFRGHPRVKDIFAGTGPLIKLSSNAAKQDQYGNVEVTVYETLEDAMKAVETALSVSQF